INRTDSPTLSNAISGTGSLESLGSGVVTLDGASSYTGTTTISAGTLRVTKSLSLGATPGGAVTVASGATLDIGGNTVANNLNFGAKQFFIAGTGVGGNGAIVNNGATAQQNAFQKVTLTADATVGGTGRFDIR